MINSWVAPAEWAQHEFAFAQWGDVRRNQRLGHSAKNLQLILGERYRKPFLIGQN